jgi:hypothetical protein
MHAVSFPFQFDTSFHPLHSRNIARLLPLRSARIVYLITWLTPSPLLFGCSDDVFVRKTGLYHKLHGVPRPVAMKKTVIKRRKRVPAVGHPIKSAVQIDELAASEDRLSEQYSGPGTESQVPATSRESSYSQLGRKGANGVDTAESTGIEPNIGRHTHSMTDSPSPRGIEVRPVPAGKKSGPAAPEETERDSREGISVRSPSTQIIQ